MFRVKEMSDSVANNEKETSDIMLDVIIALMPAAFAGVIYFGRRALAVMILAVLCCVGFEFLYQKIFRKEVKINDFSSVVTGMLLSYMLPVNIPYYVVVVGSFVASAVVKQLPKINGRSVVNPVLAGKAVLLTAFPVAMTTFYGSRMEIFEKVENTASKIGSELLSPGYTATQPGVWQMFIGQYKSGAPIVGGIGETCGLAILIGFIYLLVRKIVNVRIPLSYIGMVFVIYLLFGKDVSPLTGVLSGGVMLGAMFLTTDYGLTNRSSSEQWFFGAGCGVLTCLIRFILKTAEGVTFSIIIMNIVVLLIEKCRILCDLKRKH